MGIEKHFATVIKRLDLIKQKGLRGAIFISSDTLTGGSEYPHPVQPRFPCRGMFWVPEVDDQLEVEINEDEHPDPSIRSFVYSSEDEPDDLFMENYPYRRGWVSPSQHYLIFDDKPGVEAMLFYHNSGSGREWDFDGNELRTVVADLTEDLQGAVDRKIADELSEEVGSDVTKTWKADLKFQLDGDGRMLIKGGIRCEIRNNVDFKIKGNMAFDVTGDYTYKTSGSQTFEASGGAKLKLGGGKVGLGTAAVELIQTLVDWATEVDKWIDADIAQTHVGNLGYNTSPPVNVSTYAAQKAALLAIKAKWESIKGGV